MIIQFFYCKIIYGKSIIYVFFISWGCILDKKVRSQHMARNMCKIFSLVPSKKPVNRENWDKLSLYLLFNFWIMKLTETPILLNCQAPNGFFWCKCKFYHSKNWKVNTYFFSVFFGDRFFWGNERKYFTHIPGLKNVLHYGGKPLSPLKRPWEKVFF